MDAIPLARTRLGEAEHSAVGRVLTSGRLARGPEIAAFEAEFARFQSQSHACSIASGTAGISVVLAALGIGPGDGRERRRHDGDDGGGEKEGIDEEEGDGRAEEEGSRN